MPQFSHAAIVHASIPGFPPVDSRLARAPAAAIPLSPPPFRGRIQCWGTPAPAHPCGPEQQPVPGTAVPFLFVMCAEHPRRHLSSVRLPLLVNRALVIALQPDPPINKTDVVKSGSSHCQRLRWITLFLLLWSQVDGPSHCFDQSRPSLHPSCCPPGLTGRPTVPPSRRNVFALSRFSALSSFHARGTDATALIFWISLPRSRHSAPVVHLVLPVICLSWFYHLFFPSASLVPRLTACVPTGAAADPTPHLVLRFCRRRRISPLRPAPSHLQRFVHGGAEMAAGIDVGACRLQKGGELEIGKKASAGFLMCPFLFFLSFTPRFVFFLYCASLWVTLYDNSRHVLGYGRKTKGFGNWKGGFFRRGTVGQTRRWECTKNRTWPHTSLLYNVRLSIDTTSFTR